MSTTDMSELCQAQSAGKQHATYNQLLRRAVHRLNNSSVPLPLLSTNIFITPFTNIDDDDFSVPRSDKARRVCQENRYSRATTHEGACSSRRASLPLCLSMPACMRQR